MASGLLNGKSPGQKRKTKKALPDDEDFLAKLSDRMDEYIRLSDAEEEARRANDRLGSSIYYGRHWNVPMPRNRVALTVNVTKSLIDHKIAIMTKQRPVPVVEADDAGDVEAARIMRTVLQRYWIDDRMMIKSRDALRLCNTTRTIASKTYWDPDKRGGVGDVTTDVIPGFRMIVDPCTKDADRMEFVGDRAYLPRSRAMKLYPQSARKIADAAVPRDGPLGAGSTDSPIKGPFREQSGVDTPSGAGGAIVNGQPVITAFTGRSVGRGASQKKVEIVELYHRDRTMIEKDVPVKDSFGRVVQRIAKDEFGMPQFDQTGDWDEILEEPGFELRYEDVTRRELAPKYPFYRRTTKLMPDNIVLDDRAWDLPHPYEFLGDQPSLEGPWDKPSTTEVEDLQSSLNISLSTMLDNLRFSAFRAFKKTSTANIAKNNLVLSPGDVIDVGMSQDGLMPFDFPQLSEAWFAWINNIIQLMERIIGATGVMQGEAAGRVDSGVGYDTLAEIGGSRIVECTQRFEEWISRLMAKIGWYAQRYYTEAHAVRVEDTEGNLTWERATAKELWGAFSYRIVTGSTLAWNESSVRARVMEEFSAGLRDRISVWQKLQIEDWQAISKRILTQPPQFNPPPPTRTKQTFGAKGQKPKPPGGVPRPHG